MTFLRDVTTTEAPQWTWRDKLLALALTDHEAGLHSCGHPTSLTYSPDAEGWFDVGLATCEGCRAAEQWAREQGSTERPPGQVVLTWNAAGPNDHIRPWSGRLTPARK